MALFSSLLYKKAEDLLNEDISSENCSAQETKS